MRAAPLVTALPGHYCRVRWLRSSYPRLSHTAWPAVVGVALPEPPAAAAARNGAQPEESGTPAEQPGLNANASKQQLANRLTLAANNIEWADPESHRPVMPDRATLHAFQVELGYQFRNAALLRLALIHSSAAPTTHNGVLAWLGDSVLGLVVAEQLGGMVEGAMDAGLLTDLRSARVSRVSCAECAAKLGLQKHLVLGKGMWTSGVSSNMLAEGFEALVGAIYLDSELNSVRRWFNRRFPLPQDPRSLLVGR